MTGMMPSLFLISRGEGCVHHTAQVRGKVLPRAHKKPLAAYHEATSGE
jgi:hypothetical protein